MGEAGSEICGGLMVGGTGVCQLVLEQGLLPLVGMAMSSGVFRGRLWAQEDFR